jgi:hypothetical protein
VHEKGKHIPGQAGGKNKNKSVGDIFTPPRIIPSIPWLIVEITFSSIAWAL